MDIGSSGEFRLTQMGSRISFKQSLAPPRTQAAEIRPQGRAVGDARSPQPYW